MYQSLRIIATGGATFAAYLSDGSDDEPSEEKFLGSIEVGDLDQDGQWEGNEGDIIAAVLDQFPIAAGRRIRAEF